VCGIAGMNCLWGQLTLELPLGTTDFVQELWELSLGELSLGTTDFELPRKSVVAATTARRTKVSYPR